MSEVKGPLNSAKAPDSTLVGGVHNVQPPAPLDGQQCALQCDANGNLLVNVAVTVGGGGPSSNVNIADVNGNPPALTNPLPVELSDGTQAFGTVGNPINVTGSISATNPSVGTTGAVAPTSATEIGIIVGGNLVGVSNANPVPVSGTISSGSLTNNNAVPGANNQGVLPAVANAANPTWVEGNQVLESVDLSGNQRVKVNAALPAGTNVIGHVIADTGSTTAVTGNVTVVQPTGTNLHAVIDTGSTTAVTGNVTVVQPTGTNLHVVVDAGSTTSAQGSLTNNNAAPAANNMGVLPALANAANPTWIEGDQVLESIDLSGNQRVKVNAALPAGTNVIGHVIADTGSTTAVTGNVTVVQPTGTNLHTVIDSGTLTTVTTVTAVTAITNALPAGSNVIGHVITDTGSVTNATLSAETTKVIGTVNQGTSPWVVSGTVTSSGTATVIGTLTNNNAAPAATEVGVLPALANAVAPTWAEGDQVLESVDLKGNQRVILNAETTKAIGVVRASDGAGNLLTSNSTTPAAHFALDSNITSILGTAPTTVGKLDVKGADGDVFVRQTTGTNLHVVTDTTSTTAVTQATAANLNATVVGTGTFAVQDAAGDASLVQVAQSVRQMGSYPSLNQVAAFQSSASATSLTLTFVAAAVGDELLCVAMSSTTTKPTFLQTGGTGTAVAGAIPFTSSTTAPAVSIQNLRVSVAGTVIVTVTFASGACAAIGYGILGLPQSGNLLNSQPVYDNLQLVQGTASSATLASFFTLVPGELPFLFVGLGANTTVNSSSPGTTRLPAFTVDGTNTAQNVTTSGNLQTFFAGRISGGSLEDMTNMIPVAGFSGASLFTAVYISFKTVPIAIGGTVTNILTQIAGNNVTTAASGTQLVGNADGVGNPLTSNSTTPTAHFALDSNITSILGTAPTAAGKIDVKGADGDVFVRQATAANLNATVVVATGANTIGKVDILGNVGGVMDAVTTAATTPASGLATLVANVTTAPSLTTGQSVVAQCDYVGSLFVKPYRRSQTSSQGTTIVNSVTVTNILPVGGTGIFVDISTLIITPVETATGVAGITFTASLKDGTNTYIYDMSTGDQSSITLPGTDPVSVNCAFNPPLPAATSATQWTITLSINTVTVHITAVGVLQKAS
jgi:hypothetical protein